MRNGGKDRKESWMVSLTRLVGLLGWLVGCYYALLIGLKLSKSRWAKYFPGLRSSTEKTEIELEQAHAIRERLEEQIRHDSHSDSNKGRLGFAKLFGTFLSILVVSWAMMGWLAVRDHQTIKSQAVEITTLKFRLARYEATTPDVYTEFNVLAVYDPWDYQVQFSSGGDPFVMKFSHDGSEGKIGWDVGMHIKYLKYVTKPDGLSVAARNLGMEVLREKNSPHFVDWRKTSWTTPRQ